MNIQVNRVALKLKAMFDGKIDLSDVNENDKPNSFLSRSLALYGIMMNTDCSIDEIQKSLTDGYHDNGIDALYCDENQKIMYLIQSKWSNEGKHSISKGDTHNFIDGITKILNGNFDGFNKKIDCLKESIITAISSTDYKIKAIIIYTSNQPFSNECQDVMNTFINNANDGLEIISYSILTLKDIYNSLAEQTNSIINLDNVCLHDFGILERNEKEIGYYGKVSVSTVANWWKEHGVRLFSKNIRYYKGDTEVNTGIKNVLLNEPENFLLYNNGIKIVAERISKGLKGANGRKVGIFSLENASIVNGAQTTGTIGETIDVLEEKKDNAYVLIQMISLDSLESGMNDKITKYSNTQNRIENKDFISLDPLQKKLQLDFVMDGIEYYYKSGYSINDEEKSCSVDDVTIAVGCSLKDINIAATIKSNYGKIFEKLDKPPYTDIFNRKHSTYYIWNCVQIYRKFNSQNEKYQKETTGINRLISVHGNRFLLFVFLNAFIEDFDLKSHFLSDEKLSELNNVIGNKIPLIIDELVEIKNKEFFDAYPANIFKNANRCKQLYELLIITDVYKSIQKQGAIV